MEIGLKQLIDKELEAYIHESQNFNAALKTTTGDQPQPDPSTPEGLQAVRDSLTRSSTQIDPPASVRVAVVGDRQVPVRIITPKRDWIRAVYLNIHGGGFYAGSAASGDVRNARLADTIGVAVVSVDYRLAPEHPWPAAPDDCETAALWLLEHAPSQFGTARLAIGGVSAGATLAMATLLRLRDRGLAEPFVGAALEFGAYDLSGRSPGGRLLANEFPVKAYAGNAHDRTNPDISPLFGDLRRLPPALLVVGALDVLLEDNLAMAARLSAASNEVDLRVYPESTHDFTSYPTAMAAAAVGGIERWLADRCA